MQDRKFARPSGRKKTAFWRDGAPPSSTSSSSRSSSPRHVQRLARRPRPRRYDRDRLPRRHAAARRSRGSLARGLRVDLRLRAFVEHAAAIEPRRRIRPPLMARFGQPNLRSASDGSLASWSTRRAANSAVHAAVLGNVLGAGSAPSGSRQAVPLRCPRRCVDAPNLPRRPRPRRASLPGRSLGDAALCKLPQLRRRGGAGGAGCSGRCFKGQALPSIKADYSPLKAPAEKRSA